MDMETRLTRLEEQLYFQEHAVQEHEALLAQQKQIDRMESVLKRMADRQQKLLDMLEDKPENTLPPHYMPERY